MNGHLQCDEVTVSGYDELDRLLAFPATDGHRPAGPQDPVARTLMYRGCRDARWQLMCSLLVQLGPRCADGEELLLGEFKRHAVGDERFAAEHGRKPDYDDWHWLVLGQHYGMPSRLLDWTDNPQNAMFFAVDGRLPEHDAVITVVDVPAVHALLPPDLSEFVAKAAGSTVPLEALAGALPSLADLRGREDDPFLLFVEPHSFDSRIRQQNALLSLLSDPARPAEDVLDRAPGSWRRLRIPPPVCDEVRERLDQRSVNEFMIYRDLDGLGRWLRRAHRARLDAQDAAAPYPQSPW